MSIAQFQDDLNKWQKAKEPLPGLIVLESNDAFSTDAVIKAIRLFLFGTDDAQKIASMCQEETYRGAEGNGVATVQGVFTALQTLPMFATTKLVILRDTDELDSKAEELLLLELNELFGGKNKKAPGGTYLLLHAGKLRSNGKLKKLAEKIGYYAKMGVDRKPQFEAEIKSLAYSKGLSLSPEIIRFLSDYLPMDLSLTEREVEKLSLYAGKNGTIDLKSASELVCSTNLENVFRMTDAIGERDQRTAMQILISMLDRGESPQMLLAMLARHMRHLYRVKMVERSRVSRDEVAQALETQSSFVIEKASRQARSFSLPGLRRAIKRLFEVDRELKSTGIPAELLLQGLVDEFCRLPSSR